MIGEQVRRYRNERGLSLAQLAKLSKLSKGFLSKVENGQSSLDERRSLLNVADALGVAPHQLTGQPYDPQTRQEDTVHAAVLDIRDVLHGNTVGERYTDPSDDLESVRRTTARVVALHDDCALHQYGPILADLLGDLYAFAADLDGGVRAESLPMLVTALNATRDLAHWAGEPDLAYLAADQAVLAARTAEDPPLVGYATFGLVHSLGHVDGKHARTRAATVAELGADELQAPAAGGGPTAEMYGMLHLVSAWSAQVAGDGQRADEHLHEADDVTRLTGEGTAHRLWFGPNNAAAWRLAIAVDRGGGDVPALARAVEPRLLPSRERRAGHWINVGRGMALDPATAAHAIPAFKKARRLAPLRTRANPFVHAVTERLVWEVSGSEVIEFARWLGVIAR